MRTLLRLAIVLAPLSLVFCSDPSDDDTVPDPGCLESLVQSSAEVVLPRQRRAAGTQQWLPWVGGLFDADLVRRAGPPQADPNDGGARYCLNRQPEGGCHWRGKNHRADEDRHGEDRMNASQGRGQQEETR